MEYLKNASDTFAIIIRYMVKWMLVMTFSRVLFIIFNLHFSSQHHFSEIGQSILFGTYIDLSLTGYFTFFFLIFLSPLLFIRKHSSAALKYFNIVLILIWAIISAINITLYKDWGFPLDNSIFRYTDKPGEVGNFIHLHTLFKFIILFVSVLTVGLVSNNYFFKYFSLPKKNQLPLILVLIPLMIIPIRGGLGLSTMRPGTVYFSNEMFLNHTAINPGWNLIYSILENNKLSDQYQFMNDHEAEKIFQNWKQNGDSESEKVMKTEQPNILFIILESFSAGLIDKQYDGIFITPVLNAWKEKSIYFPNTYASGDRTDKGIVSIFSGYPAQPRNSIMNIHSKCENLPSLIESATGYHSFFYYGGDADFAGMESYLFSIGFQHILDKDEYSSSDYNAKWGVHDHILFEKFVNDIKTLPKPFFATILTLSSHPPYDIPVTNVWNESSEEALFYNSVHYTDAALGKLLESLQRSDDWENLLICIVSDHGARYPGNLQNHSLEKFRIPVIITGGAINQKKCYTKKIAQHDLPISLSSQLGWESSKFKFSQDIFEKTEHPGIFYAFNNGMGWVKENCSRIYSLDSGKDIQTEKNCEDEESKMKAYLQVLIQDYKSR